PPAHPGPPLRSPPPSGAFLCLSGLARRRQQPDAEDARSCTRETVIPQFSRSHPAGTHGTLGVQLAAPARPEGHAGGGRRVGPAGILHRIVSRRLCRSSLGTRAGPVVAGAHTLCAAPAGVHLSVPAAELPDRAGRLDRPAVALSAH